MQIQTTVGNFLTRYMRMLHSSIQLGHLGQAFVRLSTALDRDALVCGIPHHWNGQYLTFVNHADRYNHRSLPFNNECWIMLLGFPLGYWHRENIEAAIVTFGRLLIWERDETNFTRIIIEVRILSLPEVLHFIVVSDGEGFQGESWTVQCGILLQDMMGYAPEGEERPSDFPDDQEPPFKFFWLWSVGNSPWLSVECGQQCGCSFAAGIETE